MNNQLLVTTPFTFQTLNKTIRSITIDGVVWFVGKDVAETLGYKNTRDALEGVRGRFKQSAKINLVCDVAQNDTTSSRKRKTQTMILITEAGLNALVMRSTLPAAESFQDWVCDEVLPTIRKTGGYIKGLSSPAVKAIVDHHRASAESIRLRGDKLNPRGGLKPAQMESVAYNLASEFQVTPEFALAVLIDPPTALRDLD